MEFYEAKLSAFRLIIRRKLSKPLCVAMILFALGAVSFAANAAQISVDEIVARHIEALGGKQKLDAVRSVITRGEYREGSFSLPGAFMARMRPYYKTICDPRGKISEFCEGYDGSAWEWYEDPGVVLRTVGPAAAAARHGLELFDSLVDYQSQGTRVEPIGDETFGGRPAYNLRVTLEDGFEKHLFIDQETFLIIGDRRAAPIHAFGEPVRSENRISDYRQVNGVLFSFLVVEVEIGTGKELNRFITQSTEVNAKLDASFFAPPQFVRTPFQHFIEQLYLERTDPVSLMVTYQQFRAANPTLDTRAGWNLSDTRWQRWPTSTGR